MKNTNRAILVGCCMAFGPGYANAAELPFKGTFSGTNVATSLDLNGDGQPADLATFAGKTSLGRVTVQGVFDNQDVFDVEGCPEGTSVKQELVQRRDAIRFANGDLLFTDFSSQTTCVLEDLTITVEGAGNFNGGTGKFAGATGFFEVSGTGSVLIPFVFVDFTIDLEGTLILSESQSENPDVDETLSYDEGQEF